MQSFYEWDGEAYRATLLTRGPWDERFQHGGPPSALLARALERFEGADEYDLTRINVTFLRAVPIGLATVEVQPEHLGRASQRVRATLSVDGRAVLTALGLRTRRQTSQAGSQETPDWPAPQTLTDYELPFFRWEMGYHKAVDLRVAVGRWGTTPIGMWARPRVPLLPGEPLSGRQRAIIVADAQSGLGVPLDPMKHNFANPDLTVAFVREPQGDWVGLDIRSFAGAAGAGLAQSLLRDTSGLFGGASQSLIVQLR